jgi:hypothetical protein
MCLLWSWFDLVLFCFFHLKVVWQECSNFKGEKFVFYGLEFLNKLILFFSPGMLW